MLSFPDLYVDSKASRGGPQLLVAVTTSPLHFAERNAIRRSWGKASYYANDTVRVVFFLGLFPVGTALNLVKVCGV